MQIDCIGKLICKPLSVSNFLCSSSVKISTMVSWGRSYPFVVGVVGDDGALHVVEEGVPIDVFHLVVPPPWPRPRTIVKVLDA
ncbi:MAG: hypothetical protein ACLRSW_05315 [Christensenellaceae bacterium]